VRRARGLVALTATATLLLAGCGGDDAADEASSGGSMDHSSMDVSSMNDADATPAYDLPDAVEGDFTVLSSAPPGSDDVAGEAWLAQASSSPGTTVTLELSGLEPGATYMAHLHAQPCGTDDGGEHFRFDPDGDEVPPNEVHVGLEADEDGEATGTATNPEAVGDDAPSVVVHPTDLPDNRLVCADF
jgi:hypothetical protein